MFNKKNTADRIDNNSFVTNNGETKMLGKSTSLNNRIKTMAAAIAIGASALIACGTPASASPNDTASVGPALDELEVARYSGFAADFAPARVVTIMTDELEVARYSGFAADLAPARVVTIMTDELEVARYSGFAADLAPARVVTIVTDELEVARYSGFSEMDDLAILPPAPLDQLDVERYSS